MIDSFDPATDPLSLYVSLSLFLSASLCLCVSLPLLSPCQAYCTYLICDRRGSFVFKEVVFFFAAAVTEEEVLEWTEYLKMQVCTVNQLIN